MKRVIWFLMFIITLTGCAASTGKPDTPEQATTIEATPGTTPHIDADTPTTPPEIVQITVYVPNENVDGFDTVVIEGEALTFLEAMIQAGVLPEETEIHSFSLVEDTLTVDFNSAFRDLMSRQGTAGEYAIMGSIVNTLIELNDVTYIMVTVDGEILETGHVIYDFPMSFFS